MLTKNADIISQLKRDILSLQGFKNKITDNTVQPRLGPIDVSFPNGTFPISSVHEFLIQGYEDKAATCGFLACILSPLMSQGGITVWINSDAAVFAPALKFFGIEAEKIIFITAKEKDKLWIMEEALKCEGLAAVVGEINNLDFAASRRLQLAIEKSRVTCFAICNSKKITPNICASRWKITSMSSVSDDLPGVGFPAWNVELLKVRNGKTGAWQIGLDGNRFRNLSKIRSVVLAHRKKTG